MNNKEHFLHHLIVEFSKSTATSWPFSKLDVATVTMFSSLSVTDFCTSTGCGSCINHEMSSKYAFFLSIGAMCRIMNPGI